MATTELKEPTTTRNPTEPEQWLWVVTLDKSAEMSGEMNGGRNAVGDRPTLEVYQSSRRPPLVDLLTPTSSALPRLNSSG
ncbi:hypothetical protein RHGRI_029442 [Rhododendron griersonianum]|uniref:Uncharacterized protein n=1 Tax=Rhododendron griersonianum TaxID=479676 RepID=A0AAV6IP25_9ERIC|nr:hypothetical protein RHGRI_029442 [Rhododendron griersonianum]